MVLKGTRKYITKKDRTSLDPKRREQRELFLGLSSICDYSCIFCSRGFGIEAARLTHFLGTYDYRKESLSLQDIIYSGRRKHKATQVVIGGNELLSHPNIVRIVEFCKRMGFKEIIVQTTGLRFSSREFVEAQG